MFYPKNIPLEMRRNKNWVLFRKINNSKNENHPLKMMISLEGKWHRAKSTESTDWSTFTKSIQIFYCFALICCMKIIINHLLYFLIISNLISIYLLIND